MMRNTRPLVLLAALALIAFHGIAANAQTSEKMTTLEMVGRFGELETLAERSLAEQARPTTSNLAPLCLAYSRLDKYGKLASFLRATRH